MANDDPSDRTEDGAGSEPPHVPPDGEDSRLRRAGERALQEREDARPGPPVYRRGGRGGRRLWSPAPRRLDPEHASRARPLPCQGGGGQPEGRRDPPPRDALLS